MLASVAMILVAAGIGNAFAYSYQNVEWSTWYAGAVSYPYGHMYPNPTPTTYGGALTWQNTMVNNQPNTNIIPNVFSYTDQKSQQNAYQQGPTLSYHYSWGPDGSNLPVTTVGSHTLTVDHLYAYTPSWWTILFGNNAGSGSVAVPYNYA